MTPTLFTHYDLTWNYHLISICAVTEVNVGIICACLLTFPAFLERHRPRTFSSLINTLRPYSPFRKSERSSGASSNRKYFNPPSRSRGNRSDEIGPDGSDHAKLNSDGNAIPIQDITRNRTADQQFRLSSKASDSTQDLEAGPGNGKTSMDFQPIYPVPVHVPRRDASERETMFRR